MCRHFEQKGYIQHTFLLCPAAGDSEKDKKETIYANLKTLKADDICTNINDFVKSTHSSTRNSESGLESVHKYMEHKKAHEDSKSGKKKKNPGK